MKIKMMMVVAIILLAFVAIPMSVCNAAEGVTYKVTSTEGKVGDTITVTADMTTDGVFVAADYVLTYDSTALQYVSHTVGDAVSKGAMNLVNTDKAGIIKIAYTGNPAASDKTVKAANVITIKFKVLKDAESAVKFAADLSAEDSSAVTTNATDGAPIELKVTPLSTTLKGISLNKTTLEMLKGKVEALTLAYTPANTTDDKTVVWTSSDATVATVDAKGNVTGLKAGTTTITAKVGSFEAKCDVTVIEKAIESIAITGKKTVVSGKTMILKAVPTPADATDAMNVVWTSSDESVATISTTGKVTGLKVGKTTIKAVVNEKFEATYEVTVTEPVLPQTGDTSVEIGIALAIIAVVGTVIVSNRKKSTIWQ